MIPDESKQKNSDFLYTFSGERGSRVLEHLSKYCMENDCTFNAKSARMTDFNEGARSVIIEIRHWLNMDITNLEKEQVCLNKDNQEPQ